MMVGVQELHHLIYKGAVLGGLKGAGFKIFVIVDEIKGKGGKPFALFLKLCGTNCGNQAGIHSP